MQKTLRTGERARDAAVTPGARSAPPLQTLLALPATLLGAYATRTGTQTIACSQMQGSTHQPGLAQRMDLLSNGGWWGGGEWGRSRIPWASRASTATLSDART